MSEGSDSSSLSCADSSDSTCAMSPIDRNSTSIDHNNTLVNINNENSRPTLNNNSFCSNSRRRLLANLIKNVKDVSIVDAACHYAREVNDNSSIARSVTRRVVLPILDTMTPPMNIFVEKIDDSISATVGYLTNQNSSSPSCNDHTSSSSSSSNIDHSSYFSSVTVTAAIENGRISFNGMIKAPVNYVLSMKENMVNKISKLQNVMHSMETQIGTVIYTNKENLREIIDQLYQSHPTLNFWIFDSSILRDQFSTKFDQSRNLLIVSFGDIRKHFTIFWESNILDTKLMKLLSQEFNEKKEFILSRVNNFSVTNIFAKEEFVNAKEFIIKRTKILEIYYSEILNSARSFLAGDMASTSRNYLNHLFNLSKIENLGKLFEVQYLYITHMTERYSLILETFKNKSKTFSKEIVANFKKNSENSFQNLIQMLIEFDLGFVLNRSNGLMTSSADYIQKVSGDFIETVKNTPVQTIAQLSQLIKFASDKISSNSDSFDIYSQKVRSIINSIYLTKQKAA